MSWKCPSFFNFFDWSGSFTSITCPIAYWMTRWGLFSLITGEPMSKTICCFLIFIVHLLNRCSNCGNAEVGFQLNHRTGARLSQSPSSRPHCSWCWVQLSYMEVYEKLFKNVKWKGRSDNAVFSRFNISGVRHNFEDVSTTDSPDFESQTLHLLLVRLALLLTAEDDNCIISSICPFL